MFQLDEDIAGSIVQLRNLANNWKNLAPDARERILEVFNGDKSVEFYKGALSAYCAAARLVSDKNFPEDKRFMVFAGVVGLIASRLVDGEWPKNN